MNRSYDELSKLETFKERFEYVKLNGQVGHETFGSKRYVNQNFYRSKEWKTARRNAIVRDNGCDLGIPDRPIFGKVIVHHLNPITADDIISKSFKCLDPNNLISVSYNTHEALTYGDESLLIPEFKERTPNDTCPWRNVNNE